jgi:hypothetical protein
VQCSAALICFFTIKLVRAQYALIPEGESYTRSDGVRICALPDFLQQEMPVLQARQAFSAWDARAGLGVHRPSDAEVFTRKSAATTGTRLAETWGGGFRPSDAPLTGRGRPKE